MHTQLVTCKLNQPTDNLVLHEINSKEKWLWYFILKIIFGHFYHQLFKKIARLFNQFFLHLSALGCSTYFLKFKSLNPNKVI